MLKQMVIVSLCAGGTNAHESAALESTNGEDHRRSRKHHARQGGVGKDAIDLAGTSVVAGRIGRPRPDLGADTPLNRRYHRSPPLFSPTWRPLCDCRASKQAFIEFDSITARSRPWLAPRGSGRFRADKTRPCGGEPGRIELRPVPVGTSPGDLESDPCRRGPPWFLGPGVRWSGCWMSSGRLARSIRPCRAQRQPPARCRRGRAASNP